MSWQSIRDRALEAFRKLSRGQRLAALAGGALCLTALIVAGVLAGRTDWGVLYPQLDPQDAYRVGQSLEKLQIPFDVDDAGQVRVPRDQVPRARMQLAGEGLPSGGGPGYEIFDESDLSLSQDAFGVRMERAKMGHLRAAIETLSQVQSAIVSVNLPKRSSFALRSNERPSAGVSLSLRPGSTLDRDQVAAMVHLVVGHVGNGIREEDVRITDEGLHLLWPVSEEQGLASRHRRIVEEEEARLERKALSLLEETLGPEKASLRVSLELDTTYRETQKETRSPSNRVTIRETLSTGADRDGEDSTLENVAGVEHSLHIQDQPKIQHLGIALLLDQTDPAVAANEATLGDLVKSALGFDARRGDRFTSSLVQFHHATPDSPAPPGWQERVQPWIAPSAEALGIALVLFVLWRLLRPARGGGREGGRPVPDGPDLDALQDADPRVRLEQYVRVRPQDAREELLQWLGEERRR